MKSRAWSVLAEQARRRRMPVRVGASSTRALADGCRRCSISHASSPVEKSNSKRQGDRSAPFLAVDGDVRLSRSSNSSPIRSDPSLIGAEASRLELTRHTKKQRTTLLPLRKFHLVHVDKGSGGQAGPEAPMCEDISQEGRVRLRAIDMDHLQGLD